jgi:hypothetical protein
LKAILATQQPKISMTIPILNFSAGPLRIGTRTDFSHTIFSMTVIPPGDWQGVQVESSEDRGRVRYRIHHDRWTFDQTLLRDPRGARRVIGPGLVGRVTSACAWLTEMDQFHQDGDRVPDDWTRGVAHEHWRQFREDHGDCTVARVACQSAEDFHRMREIARDLDGRATVYRFKDAVEIIGTVEDVALVKFAA